MDRNEVIDRLKSLMKLDYDAVLAYNMACDNVRTREVRGMLQEFRRHHERHVKDLGDAIRREGGEPFELSKGVRGVFLEGMTAVTKEMGERAVLRACETGEKYMNYKYGQAAVEKFRLPIAEFIKRNYADERRHLSYVEKRLTVTTARWGIGKTIGIGAVGAAAGVALWRRIASR